MPTTPEVPFIPGTAEDCKKCMYQNVFQKPWDQWDQKRPCLNDKVVNAKPGETKCSEVFPVIKVSAPEVEKAA